MDSPGNRSFPRPVLSLLVLGSATLVIAVLNLTAGSLAVSRERTSTNLATRDLLHQSSEVRRSSTIEQVAVELEAYPGLTKLVPGNERALNGHDPLPASRIEWQFQQDLSKSRWLALDSLFAHAGGADAPSSKIEKTPA